MVRDGYFYALGFGAAAAVLGLLTHTLIWTPIPILLALFFLWFFRDPNRQSPDEPGLIVSPADGKITEVARVEVPGGEMIRLSIFLSVFDVHVNRSPISGVVRRVQYRKGRYLNALNPESAVQNEQNIVIVQGEDCEVTFKQIAGLLARRIVFRPKEGDSVERGQRVGLIKFGSRVDVHLPGHARLRVTPGTRVRGGTTVLAEVDPATQRQERELAAVSLP